MLFFFILEVLVLHGVNHVWFVPVKNNHLRKK